MIPRLKPRLGLSELAAALQFWERNGVEVFEAEFAARMGQDHALAFPYGRTGLQLLLEAMGLQNKEIICPAYTCVVVPHAIVYSGNTPVFVDCAPDDFNMDLDLAEQAITENTGAIIPTSLFGYPVDLDRLNAVRNHHPDVKIIQDCAHSFQAGWNSRPVNKEGIAALYGLNISKLLTSIFGGMITTDDHTLYRKLKAHRDERQSPPSWQKGLKRFLYLMAVYPTFWGPVYGMVNRLERSGLIDRFVRYYDETSIDMPDDYLIGMSPVEGRVGRANLHKYDRIIASRRDAAQYYHEILPHRPDFIHPPVVNGATYSHYVVEVQDRQWWLQQGLKRGVQLGWLIEYTIPEMNAYGSHPPDAFPNAARLARHTINLPVWGGSAVAKRVVNCIRLLLDFA
ncbi:MAG TPA: DegT/DnrJ/EryC1/StrS family aminotransferase [bacterium]|nr:DegT/DnrJ/EryC1/StrS family aminotransferase [bacterium]